VAEKKREEIVQSPDTGEVMLPGK